MVKIIYLLAIVSTLSNASQSFEDTCIQCHQDQEIPNEVIYKRYLLKYSSDTNIREAMVNYLKNPMAERTIMPAQFITIFGLKEACTLSDEKLNQLVDEFINKYDIKRKIVLPQK